MSELSTDYMERAAPLRTRLAMWLHLTRCEACRRYFDQLRRTAALLGRHPPDAVSNATEEGLLASVRSRRPGDP